MPQSLLQILRKKKLVDPAELSKAEEIEKKSGVDIGQILFKKGLIGEFELVTCVAEQYELSTEETLKVSEIEKLVNTIPINFVRKYRVVPYSLKGSEVKVALYDPSQLHPLDEIRFLLSDYDVTPVMALESEILKIIHYYYEERGGKKGSSDITFDDNLDFLEELDDLQDSLDLANEAPIIKMVNVMITNAVNDLASDIHIEPQEKELNIRYRVDGILRKVLNPPKSIQSGITSRIKIMADMNIAETRLPQDGKIRIRTGGKEVDIRVSSLPTEYGERMVLRLLNKSDYDFRLDNIGFEKNTINKFRSLISEPNGIVLITGPTGSGKTTTLYSALNELNLESRNIITVEDPVEYQIDGISQVQAKPKIGLTFAEGLRSILRQDPDIVMVGEIRDEETARVATQAALTGHLVFSTLHTNDAPSAVSRLLDMKIEPFLLSATVKGIMAQRLVRILCKKCKKKITIPGAALKDLGVMRATRAVEKSSAKKGAKTSSKQSNTSTKKSVFIYEHTGCDDCNQTGYKGRIGIYEFLILDEKIRSIVLNKPGEDEIRKLAKAQGMQTLREAALKKVLEGVTSLEEAMRVS